MAEFGSGSKPKYRSVSQINQYNRCPYQYKLSRIDKVWKRPAAWLPQGSAVHEALEAWEKSARKLTLEETQDIFREAFQKYTNGFCKVTPNWQFWFKSGPYGGFEDTERRYEIGLEQVEKLINWAVNHPNERVWVTPEGTPAIELYFSINLGGIPVRGYIDLVVEVEVSPGVWEVRVRDYKTGNDPGDDFQLGVYALAIWLMFGVKVEKGDYFMAGKKGKPGKPTFPYDLTEWTEEAVTAEFLELERHLEAEEFPPDPEPDKCNFCDVNASCEFAVG
jgi:putative RecB family exonuclease